MSVARCRRCMCVCMCVGRSFRVGTHACMCRTMLFALLLCFVCIQFSYCVPHFWANVKTIAFPFRHYRLCVEDGVRFVSYRIVVDVGAHIRHRHTNAKISSFAFGFCCHRSNGCVNANTQFSSAQVNRILYFGIATTTTSTTMLMMMMMVMGFPLHNHIEYNLFRCAAVAAAVAAKHKCRR